MTMDTSMSPPLEERTVRWGALGCGRVLERRMAPAFAAAPNAVLAAVGSRERDKAEQTAVRLGVPRGYGSYDDLLADPQIDAVYICLPNDLHAEWTTRALQAGKHVLCDKPAALSYAEALAMANAARAADRFLVEGFMFRHHPQHAYVGEVAARGEIGEVIHFRSAFSYLSEPQPGAFRWNAAQGGGALLDLVVYGLNAVRMHFAAEPVAVFATARWDEERGVDKHTAAVLEFSGGRTATLLGSFDQVFTTQYELIGSKGVITCSRAFQIGEQGVTVTVRVGDDMQTENFPHIDQYLREVAHISDSILHPEKSLWPSEDGVAQARAVEALVRSAREQRRIELSEIH